MCPSLQAVPDVGIWLLIPCIPVALGPAMCREMLTAIPACGKVSLAFELNPLVHCSGKFPDVLG